MFIEVDGLNTPKHSMKCTDYLKLHARWLPFSTLPGTRYFNLENVYITSFVYMISIFERDQWFIHIIPFW